MIQVHVQCPFCNHVLIDAGHRIDSRPAIKVDIASGKKKGKLYLSALYGSYHIDLNIPCPEGKLASFYCPHCREELKSTRLCEVCSAPMAFFALKEGGTLQICTRRGCKKHLIEFQDPELELRTFYDTYNTFFKGH